MKSERQYTEDLEECLSHIPVTMNNLASLLEALIEEGKKYGGRPAYYKTMSLNNHVQDSLQKLSRRVEKDLREILKLKRRQKREQT